MSLDHAIARYRLLKDQGSTNKQLTRLVGEIGELIAEENFGMRRLKAGTRAIDGMLGNRTLQVKTYGHGSITDASRLYLLGVDILLVIKIDLTREPAWLPIYFGSAKDVLDASWHRMKDGVKQITLYHMGLASGAKNRDYITDMMESYNRNTTISSYKSDQIQHIRRLARLAIVDASD